MRLAGWEKVGFYPTPGVVVEMISRRIIPPASGLWRLLDPCAGEGEAAAQCAALVGGMSETLGVELSYSRAAVAAQRLTKVVEGAWRSVRVKMRSVSLLWLNPPYGAGTNQGERLETEFLRTSLTTLATGGVLVYIVPRHVLGDVDVARLLAGNFEAVDVRRFPDGEFERFRQIVVLARRRAKYHPPTKEAVLALRALAEAELPPLTGTEGRYRLPAVPEGEVMRLVAPSDNHLLREALKVGLPREVKRGIVPEATVGKGFTPIVPLKKGHVAMLIASGLMGTLEITTPDGETMLVKGRVAKEEAVVSSAMSSDGKKSIVVTRESFKTTISTLSSKGLQVIDEVKDLEAFMQEHGEALARAILDQPPLYRNDPTREEWATVSALGKGRRPLPGQREAGLLPVQKHAAIALARALRKRKKAIVQGEMGLGKTTIALATLALRKKWPAVVICPPHLVPKWIREAGEVLGEDVYAVELKRIADVEAFAKAVAVRGRDKPAIAVMAATSAKLGGGWKVGATRRRHHYKDANDNVHTLEVAACPHCGWDPTQPLEGAEEEKRLPLDFLEKKKSGRRCPKCGTVLTDYGQGRFRRWPLADYIRRKHKSLFRVLVADEVHQFKGQESDRALAFHHLVRATEEQLALTGTFFGGRATSIFWLLHRLNVGGVSRRFAFNDVARWIERYGLLEKKEVYQDKDVGHYSGRTKVRTQSREVPGISPAIMELMAENVLFLTLKDLGVALPDYAEEVVLLTMSEKQARSYRRVQSALWDLASQDRSYLSAWLQWSLARPNSAFRTEKVQELNNRVLPAVVQGKELLPKEQWLVEFCKAEATEYRRVVVFLRQTGTRDIQPRIVEVLRRAGLKAGHLPGSVNPRKREAWLKEHPYQVLITNPRLVETGLDLVEYATVVFFEIEYSLYTLWQAMRRVWRLGQKRPVRVVFAVYKDTMEERAMRLMGQKMRAAQLLYGDEVGGAIVPEGGADSFLTELARSVLEDAELPDLKTIFGAAAQVATVQVEAEPQEEQRRPSLEELRAAMAAMKQQRPKRRKRKAQQLQPAAQLPLFGFA